MGRLGGFPLPFGRVWSTGERCVIGFGGNTPGYRGEHRLDFRLQCGKRKGSDLRARVQNNIDTGREQGKRRQGGGAEAALDPIAKYRRAKRAGCGDAEARRQLSGVGSALAVEEGKCPASVFTARAVHEAIVGMLADPNRLERSLHRADALRS